MADCAELVDQIEAWPEDPELVDETEMRGRWAKLGLCGTRKAADTTEAMVSKGSSSLDIGRGLESLTQHTVTITIKRLGFDISAGD